MPRGINKVIIIGNLGKDPETRYLQSGTVVANISVATSETWKDKQTGENKERTEWHNIVFFGKLAEIVGQYLKKGSQVYVSGKLQTEKWQDKDGNDRYTTKIHANEMLMLGGKASDDNPQSSQAQGSAPSNGGGDMDDDIPFTPVHWMG